MTPEGRLAIAARNRSLRILFLSREYPPETGGGGIGTYVETIARALVARGHEVHVLSCVPRQRPGDHVRDGVHLHRRGVRRVLPKLRRRIPATARRIEGALSCYLEYRRLGLDVDVVEAPDWMAEGLVFALLRGLPLIGHLHTPLPVIGRNNPGSFRWTRDAQVAGFLERMAIRRADLITSPSKLLVAELARLGWFRSDAVTIVRYPADTEAWTNLASADSAPPRVLAVGRLEALKAPEILVQAASILAPDIPGLDIVFAGRSGLRNGHSYREWLRELAAELHAPCRFVGELSSSELAALYGSSRALALCSLHDNFPFAALEAMGAGRPVVCTDRTGTAELVHGSSAGAVVPVGDSAALAAALRPYLVDPELARAAGRAARSLVAHHCSPKRIGEEREVCYREAQRRWRQAKRERGRARLRMFRFGRAGGNA
jgi:glycogen synthase